MQLFRMAFLSQNTNNELEISENEEIIEFRINTDDGSTLSVDLTKDDMKHLVFNILKQIINEGW